MKIETHNGIKVLRDDLLAGGTKSILMPSLIEHNKNYVYASPVFGGFQIALSAYCGNRATIVCAKRKELHPNTIKCREYGANIIEVPFGYLSVVEKHARDYAEKTGSVKLIFGANTTENKILLGNRMREVIKQIGSEPKEIWVAIGSGTLVESILQATETAQINGVQVGQEYKGKHERLKVHKYHKSFDKESKFIAPFQSMPNYDLKAFEYCNHFKQSEDVLFWNVF